MRGEEMDELFAGYAGDYGDRLFTFVSEGNPREFPSSLRATSGG
jgi:hypothetical protein